MSEKELLWEILQELRKLNQLIKEEILPKLEDINPKGTM